MSATNGRYPVAWNDHKQATGFVTDWASGARLQCLQTEYMVLTRGRLPADLVEVSDISDSDHNVLFKVNHRDRISGPKRRPHVVPVFV